MKVKAGRIDLAGSDVVQEASRRTLVGIATSPGVGFGPVGSRVVVASDLSPAGVASLATGTVAAVVTAEGAPLSHAAILVRSLGIPAVAGLGRQVLDIPPGVLVLVDGDTGTVRVDPTPEEVDAARARQVTAAERRESARRSAAGPAVTRDGATVLVLANVGSVGDAEGAVGEGADGVGMLRTEFTFLGHHQPPDEDEQYSAYRGVADAIGGRPLVIRTLDLGSDVPAWNAPPEPNPALGHRGIRLSLADRSLLRTQLAAVARLASERPLGVLLPMVTTIEEVRRARACLDEVLAAAPCPPAAGALRLGVTVEVPAASLIAEIFAPLVDFFAIGTNDLTQYTLAADRANAAVAHLADGLHPAVLALIGNVASVANRHQKTVCVVGELATDPLALPILLGLGVTTVSVRPNAVGAVKEVVRSLDLGQARRLAHSALAAESAPAVRRLVSGPPPPWPAGDANV